MANIHKIFLAIFATILLVSCSPRYITKTDVQIDTIFKTKYQRDSVHIHDSVATSIFTVGDTIYITKYKSVIRYREKLKTDTLRQIKQVTKTDTEIIEVKKKHSWFSPFVYGLLCGGLLLLILQSRNGKMK